MDSYLDSLQPETVKTLGGELRRARIQTIPPYAADLRKRLQPFHIRVPDPDLALLADSDLYEEVRQDPVVSHALEYLGLLVAGSEWDIIPAPGDPRSARLVPFVKGALDHIHDFAWIRKYLTDAVMMGMALGKKVRSGPDRSRRIGSDIVKRRWTLVDAIEPVDKRRIEIERMWNYEREPTIGNSSFAPIRSPLHYWKIYDPYDLGWWIIEDRAIMPNARLANQDFVWHFSENREDRVGYGRGILELLYTSIRIKSHLTQYRAAYCEKFAMPWLLAKIDTTKRVTSAALAGGDIHTLSDVVTEWMDLLTQMQGRHVAVCDKNDDITTVEPAGTGNDHIASFIDYIDRTNTQLILGATLNTQQQTGGTTSTSMAQSKTHEASTDAVVKYHRTRLEESIRDDIIKGFIYDNYEIFAAMGLEDAEPPLIRLQDDRQLDPAMSAQMLQVAAQLGLGEYVAVEESLESLHLKTASVGERTIGAAQAGMQDVISGGGGLKIEGMMGDPAAMGTGTEMQFAQKPGVDFQSLSSLYHDAIKAEDKETQTIVRDILRQHSPPKNDPPPRPLMEIVA